MTEYVRHVARVLIINDAGETYLLRGRDTSAPQRAPFWFTPGGKIDPGETTAQAACRELVEEVGLIVLPEQLGDVIGTELCDYYFHGESYRQNGVFYAHFSNDAGINHSGFSDLELDTIEAGKWWSLAELISTSQTIYPVHLGDILSAALRRNKK